MNLIDSKKKSTQNSSKTEKKLNTDLKLTEKELTELRELCDALAEIIVDGQFENLMYNCYV